MMEVGHAAARNEKNAAAVEGQLDSGVVDGDPTSDNTLLEVAGERAGERFLCAFIDEGEGGPLWSDSKDDQEDEELCLLDKKEINGVLRASAFYRI